MVRYGVPASGAIRVEKQQLLVDRLQDQLLELSLNQSAQQAVVTQQLQRQLQQVLLAQQSTASSATTIARDHVPAPAHAQHPAPTGATARVAEAPVMAGVFTSDGRHAATVGRTTTTHPPATQVQPPAPVAPTQQGTAGNRASSGATRQEPQSLDDWARLGASMAEAEIKPLPVLGATSELDAGTRVGVATEVAHDIDITISLEAARTRSAARPRLASDGVPPRDEPAASVAYAGPRGVLLPNTHEGGAPRTLASQRPEFAALAGQPTAVTAALALARPLTSNLLAGSTTPSQLTPRAPNVGAAGARGAGRFTFSHEDVAAGTAPMLSSAAAPPPSYAQAVALAGTPVVPAGGVGGGAAPSSVPSSARPSQQLRRVPSSLPAFKANPALSVVAPASPLVRSHGFHHSGEHRTPASVRLAATASTTALPMSLPSPGRGGGSGSATVAAGAGLWSSGWRGESAATSQPQPTRRIVPLSPPRW